MKGEKLINEALLYVTIDHKNIIKTYGLVKPSADGLNSNSVLLLQEYARDGDLYRLLSERYFIPSQAVLLEIFIQISDAMVYLSKHHIIHGDLACRNVLVFKSHPDDPKRNLIKIIDFSLTRDNTLPSNVKLEIPTRYAALEILRSQGRSDYSEQSDVYSFAVLLWEAYSPDKRMPYQLISSDEEVCRQKLNGKRLERPDKCDSHIWAIMLKCWSDRPQDRPNFQRIHSQLKDIQNSEISTAMRGDKHSDVYNIEYNTCEDEELSDTDYESHLNSCSEQQMKFDKLYEQHRRGSVQKYKEIYPSFSDMDHGYLKSSSVSSTKLESDIQLPSEFCQNKYNRDALDDHQRNCSDNLRNLSVVSSLREPPGKTHDRRSGTDHQKKTSGDSESRSSSALVPSTPRDQRIASYISAVPTSNERPFRTSQRTIDKQESVIRATDQLPCETCEKLIDSSEFQIHQEQCLKADRRRLSFKRKEIEKLKDDQKVECRYCKGTLSINTINSHENSCEQNPINTKRVQNNQTQIEPPIETEKPTGLGKIFSSIWPFSKKK